MVWSVARQCGLVWSSPVWYGMAHSGLAWYGVVPFRLFIEFHILVLTSTFEYCDYGSLKFESMIGDHLVTLIVRLDGTYNRSAYKF